MESIDPRACILTEVVGDITKCTISPFVIIGYNYAEARSNFYNTNFAPNPSPRPVTLGDGVFVGAQSIISTGACIGKDSVIEHQCFVGEDSKIGESCFVRYRSQIFRRVTLGNNCIVGGFLCNDTILENNVTFFGISIHRYLTRKIGIPESAPKICKGAFVGFNAQIVGGIVIGSRAVIKTGAIVLKSVPDDTQVNAGQVYRD